MHRLVVFFISALLATLTWAQSAPAATGEVTKLDKAGGRVTLKHGEIKNLDMPPMTMVFRVSDPTLLDNLAVGSRIRFTADRVNGQYVLTSVLIAP